MGLPFFRWCCPCQLSNFYDYHSAQYYLLFFFLFMHSFIQPTHSFISSVMDYFLIHSFWLWCGFSSIMFPTGAAWIVIEARWGNLYSAAYTHTHTPTAGTSPEDRWDYLRLVIGETMSISLGIFDRPTEHTHNRFIKKAPPTLLSHHHFQQLSYQRTDQCSSYRDWYSKGRLDIRSVHTFPLRKTPATWILLSHTISRLHND